MTTASTAGYPSFPENRFLHWMCAAAALAFLISAYQPEKVYDWWLENVAVFMFVGALIATYRKLPLSDATYLLIVLFLNVHEWGAHYKYSDVPLGEWMKPWLHTTRNSYDRVIHFCYGFLLGYPMQEFTMRVLGVRNRWRYVLPVMSTLAFSAAYEMAEALMASILTPERGEEFVGMQGDMWDSQKDMFNAGLGAVIAMAAVLAVRHYRAPKATLQPIKTMAAQSK